MRELKFRVPVKAVDGITTVLQYSYDPTQWGQHWVDKAWLIARSGREIELYTGLKDKNGKEIYEGDIVRTTSKVTDGGLIFLHGVIVLHQQAFWIYNAPYDSPDWSHSETLLKYCEDELEVIGNIHENPELLEEK